MWARPSAGAQRVWLCQRTVNRPNVTGYVGFKGICGTSIRQADLRMSTVASEKPLSRNRIAAPIPGNQPLTCGFVKPPGITGSGGDRHPRTGDPYYAPAYKSQRPYVETAAMPEHLPSAAVRRARFICAVGALVCAAVFLISIFAASMQEDRARTRADQHGLTVCHPNTACRPPTGGDVGCAGTPNELCHLTDGSILRAGNIDYAEARPTGWKILHAFSGVIGTGFLMVLGMLISGVRHMRRQEAQ
jgi:hypothetical protein